jgi:hypothetical protein
MCSPHLATGMWDRLCAAIRLLLLGSAGGGRLSVAESSLGNSRSGSCLAFVTRTMKLLRRSSAESVCGEGVLLTTSVVATAVVLPEVAALTNTRLTPGCPPGDSVTSGGPCTCDGGGESAIHCAVFTGERVSTRDVSTS